MQTFLNEATFEHCARHLDPIRLRKQFVEARQIMDVLLENPKARWRNHPAVLQWKGYEPALYNYAMEIGWEIKRRGWKYQKNMEVLDLHFAKHLSRRPFEYPDWWLDAELKAKIIKTHRARLHEKDPVFYEKYVAESEEKKVCCPRCNYFWPSHHYRNIGKRDDRT